MPPEKGTEGKAKLNVGNSYRFVLIINEQFNLTLIKLDIFI